MRRFVLGTAGHVDHGKTTLVRALTGVDTDRLPEEKRRGITIELGFAPWDLGDLQVSIIDVPGHRRLVHTMIAGAAGIQLVLLVVAADEGVMPQTREHIAACELLGLRRAVIAVTKLDRAGEDLATLAGEEARELLGDRFEVDVVLCSAKTGEGIEALRDAVRRALLSLEPRVTTSRSRLSVDRVFSVKGAGTVITGTLVEGAIETGTPMFVIGEAGARETVARGLHIHDVAATRAEAPTRLAVNLAGLTKDDVHRGDVITSDGAVAATRLLDVALGPGAKLKHGARATLYIGTARTTVRVDLLTEKAAAIEAESEQEGEAESGERIARLRLHAPIVAFGGDRFVLRGSDIDGPSGAVIGGGRVLDASPPRARPRAARRAALQALREGDAAAIVRSLAAESSPRPLRMTALGARFAMATRELEKAAEQLMSRGELAKIKNAGMMPRSALLELAAAARALVAEHHAKAPLDRGIVRETLRQQLAKKAGVAAADEAIRLAASAQTALSGEPLVVEADVVRLGGFLGGAVGGEVGTALEKAVAMVAEAQLRGVTENALREATDASPREVKAILAKIVRDGGAVHAGDLWFDKPSVDDLRARVEAHLAREKRLTIADFKAICGLGRKQVIPLLEMFDREGVTRREGDDRVAGRS